MQKYKVWNLHGHHPDRLFRPLHGRDPVPARRALGREDPVEVVDAVDLVVEVDGEGDPVETVVADAAAETAGVVGLTHSLQGRGLWEFKK